MYTKEPYTYTKEPYTYTKEPYTYTKEPYTYTKEPVYICKRALHIQRSPSYGGAVLKAAAPATATRTRISAFDDMSASKADLSHTYR